MDELLSIAGRNHAALPLDVLAGLTLLSIAPFVLVLSTSFVRIVVVLSLVRSAIGAASLPPNTVLTGLALVLTFVIMTPTFERIERDALRPYAAGTLTQRQFLGRAIEPLREFMLRQTKRRDIDVFARIAQRRVQAVPAATALTPAVPAATALTPAVPAAAPLTRAVPTAAPLTRAVPTAAPLTVLIPAFVVGELRSAFAIGVALYLPFVAIDLAVAAVLMGLGMFMLSPPIISLPCKLLLFVLVDGWALVCNGVVASFR